ncbi:hypothetical protein D9M68_738030 [compost metagenome]
MLARLRWISSLAALCCSTALAICRFMPLISLTWPLIRARESLARNAWSRLSPACRQLCCIAATAWLAPCWRLSISALISSVERWVREARVRTSSATTAKPRPASPARAASMAAFNASRLVCSATPRITPSTSLISPLWPCNACTAWLA